MKYLSTGNAVFKLCYHIVLVTKYRKKILNSEMLKDIEELCENILNRNKCNLLEVNGEADHIHLLVDTIPNSSITKLINSMKTISSRVLRKKYKISQKALWSPSYFIATCGEVKIDILKRYIENQGNIASPPKHSLGGA